MHTQEFKDQIARVLDDDKVKTRNKKALLQRVTQKERERERDGEREGMTEKYPCEPPLHAAVANRMAVPLSLLPQPPSMRSMSHKTRSFP